MSASQLGLKPSYNRDYKSKKEVLNALNSNLDFEITTIGYNTYCNSSDLLNSRIKCVSIRYKKLTQQCIVKYNESKQLWE